MTPQQCKELLDAGILQAYAEGKELEARYPSNSKWESINTRDTKGLCFNLHPTNYRIKPSPVPHTFETAIKAIAEHGLDLIAPCGKKCWLKEISRCALYLDDIGYPYISLMSWTFPDGTPFHQGEK